MEDFNIFSAGKSDLKVLKRGQKNEVFSPLDTHTKFVCTQNQKLRFLFDSMRKISGKILACEKEKEKGYSRVSLCGCARIASNSDKTPVHLYKGENGNYFSGLVKCGSVWRCPVCSYKITQGRGKEMKKHRVSMWYKNYSFHQALDYCNSNFSDGIFKGQTIDFEKEQEIKSYHFQVKELHSSALLYYLEKRGINLDFAFEFCNEIHYQSFSKKKNRMVNYYGIGFENSLGGFAFRNQFLKFDLVAKSFSLIENFGDHYDSDILIFEGFFDFLSYITLTKKQLRDKYMPAMYENYIVLNSVSMLQTKRFKDFFREFFQYKSQKSGFVKKVQCYLDNGPYYD